MAKRHLLLMVEHPRHDKDRFFFCGERATYKAMNPEPDTVVILTGRDSDSYSAGILRPAPSCIGKSILQTYVALLY